MAMKKNSLLWAAFFWLTLLPAFSQQIIWERSYGHRDRDDVYAIVTTDNGFIAAGGTDTLGGFWRGMFSVPGYYPGALLINLGTNGDTISTINLHCLGFVKGLQKTTDGNLFASVAAIDTHTHYMGIRLFKVRQNGTILWQHDFDSTSKCFGIGNICVTSDGGALLVGRKNPEPGTGGVSDGFLLRVGPNGDEIWRQTLRPSGLTYINYSEVLNGTSDKFLVSGNAGHSVYAAWLDSAGAVTKEHLFWSDPYNTQLNTAVVLQTPDSGYVACGYNSSSHEVRYIGKFNKTGTMLWDEQDTGSCIAPFVNTNGYVMLQYSNKHGNFFKKFTPTGFPLTPVALPNRYPYLNAITSAAWLGNDSAVFAGYNTSFSHADDFYFVKMAGVGNGYVSALPRLVSEEAVRVSLYPNPAQNQTSISYALPAGTGEAEVTVFEAATGRSIQKYRLDQTTGTLNIDTQGYIPGFYGLRLTASGLASETRKLVILK